MQRGLVLYRRFHLVSRLTTNTIHYPFLVSLVPTLPFSSLFIQTSTAPKEPPQKGHKLNIEVYALLFAELPMLAKENQTWTSKLHHYSPSFSTCSVFGKDWSVIQILQGTLKHKQNLNIFAKVVAIQCLEECSVTKTLEQWPSRKHAITLRMHWYRDGLVALLGGEQS